MDKLLRCVQGKKFDKSTSSQFINAKCCSDGPNIFKMSLTNSGATETKVMLSSFEKKKKN